MGAAAGIVAVGLGVFLVRGTGPNSRDVLESLEQTAPAARVAIEYPLDGTLFPPEIAAPAFRWKDGNAHCDLWLVSVEFGAGRGRVSRFVPQPQWRPETTIWERIKKRSFEAPAVVTMIGVNRATPAQALSVGRVTIRTSADKVGAPLFYREVNLPFATAVKDPSTIRWRFGSVSSTTAPPVVLENLPVCGNCHSFSTDGAVLGMDIDYANDKGSYAIAPVGRSMTLDRSRIITWSDYQRDEKEPTFGLLSQVSPDGRYVVSTVKDESVFVAKPGLDFSQLFFPVKGILCVYDRQTRTFRSLPGADDPKRVQSNPTWSPDGKWVVFAATEAYRLRHSGSQRGVLLSAADCREFLEDGKPFQFDLYRIPFNEGQGGQAEPIAGASFNGRSNFFPRYSPDGKWIVFCQAANYMLLQPDSELYIIPAAGGEARRLRANTRRMNSWHSFSPNGKWLVFSGKPDAAFTRLYLTHIDEQGESTPAVVLDHLTSPDRAANIPEFVNADSEAIARIREQFIDDVSYTRAALEYLTSGDFDGARRQAQKALALNPQSGDALHCLGLAMLGRGEVEEAIRHLSQAAVLKPDDTTIEADLGAAFVTRNRLDEGVRHLRRALELDPNNANAHFTLGMAAFRRGDKSEAIRCWSRTVELKPGDCDAHHNLAIALDSQNRLDEAIEHYRQAVQLRPKEAMTRAQMGAALCARGATAEGLAHLSNAAHLEPANRAVQYLWATTLAQSGQHDQAIAQYLKILRLDPRHVDAMVGLAASYVQTRQRDKALACLEEAMQIAQTAGDRELASQLAQRIGELKGPRH